MIKVRVGYCIEEKTSMSGGEFSMNETTKDTNLLITKSIIQGWQLAVGKALLQYTSRLND